MKKMIYMTAAALVCSGLLFTSCKKKETEDNDTTGAAEAELGETHSNDITNIGTQASYGSGFMAGTQATYRGSAPDQFFTTCATLTFDTLAAGDPDTLTVDFGSGGCVGKDGRTRKGVLQYTHSHNMHYRDSGNVITVSTPGNTYYVDGDQVIINSKTITNNGHDATNGYLSWTVTCDLKVNRANGNVLTWSGTKYKFLTAGEVHNAPIDWPHAKVAMYGGGSGTHTKSGGSSQSFSISISQSDWLVRDFSCSTSRRFFVAGIMTITPSNKPARIINFGTGNCDNNATVTINGHVYNITLH